MSSQVELAPSAVDRVPPLRHIFEGRRPPVTGERALCGHEFYRPTGGRMKGSATRDHCVVCVDLARARGYRL